MKEYTALRRFYAWVGFLFLAALASILLYVAICYGADFISSYLK